MSVSASAAVVVLEDVVDRQVPNLFSRIANANANDNDDDDDEFRSFRRCLHTFRKRQYLTDAFLLCDRSAFPIHKVVLASQSDYFRRAFDLKTGAEEEDADAAADADADAAAASPIEKGDEVVALHGVDSKAVELLLKYMYVGASCLKALSVSTLRALVLADNKLTIRGFRPVLLSWIRKNCRVTANNFANLWQLVLETSFWELEQVLIGLPSDSFLHVSNCCESLSYSPQFLSLPVCHVRELHTRCCRSGCWDDNKVGPGLHRAVAAYLAHHHLPGDHFYDLDDREQQHQEKASVRSVLSASPTKLIRCGSGSGVGGGGGGSSDRRQHHQRHALYSSRSSNTSSRYSSSSISHRTNFMHHYGDTQKKRATFDTLKQPALLALVGDNYHRTLLAHYASLHSHTWTTKADLVDLPFQTRCAGFAYAGRKLYMVGGMSITSGAPLDTCLSWDLQHGRMASRVPSLRIPRTQPSAVVVNGVLLFALGGIGLLSKRLSQMEMWEYGDPSWTPATPMALARDEMTSADVAVGDQNLLFVIGGGTNKCEEYNIRYGHWRHLPRLPECFCKGKAMLGVGGFGQRCCLFAFQAINPSHVYTLAPSTDSRWQLCSVAGKGGGGGGTYNQHHHLPDVACCVTSHCGKVFAATAGGTVHSYDSRNRTWEFFSKVPKPMSELLHIAVVDCY